MMNLLKASVRKAFVSVAPLMLSVPAVFAGSVATKTKAKWYANKYVYLILALAVVGVLVYRRMKRNK